MTGESALVGPSTAPLHQGRFRLILLHLMANPMDSLACEIIFNILFNSNFICISLSIRACST